MFYHEEQRYLQDRFDTRRLADRLEERIVLPAIDEEDKQFIESRNMFFLATVDGRGYPNCSYKGGDPGFVRVINEQTVAFPNYDGNGMYLSMGNIRQSRQVGMLFIDWEHLRRLRLNGEATIDENDPPGGWVSRGSVYRARQGEGSLCELSALHSPSQGRRAIEIRATSKRDDSRAGLETSRVRRRCVARGRSGAHLVARIGKCLNARGSAEAQERCVIQLKQNDESERRIANELATLHFAREQGRASGPKGPLLH